MNAHQLENEKRIAMCALTHGITGIFVSFSGGGDSGQIDSIETRIQDTPTDANKIYITVFVEGAVEFNKDTNNWERPPVKEHTVTLYAALEAHVYSVLQDTHIDWYNDDGGSGEWFWDVQSNKVRFIVGVYEVVSETVLDESRIIGQEVDTEE